jgi:Peptidase family M1 domain
MAYSVSKSTTASSGDFVMIRHRLSAVAVCLLTVCFASLRAQRPPNANAYYQQLRSLLPSGEVIAIHQVELRRDAATFTFSSGSVDFYGEVNGKITGAVFRGQGHLHIAPPTAEERHNLFLFTHTEEFDEDFDEAVLRFTDSTATDLRNASAGPGQPDASFTKSAEDVRNLARHSLHDNVDLRLLADVASPAPGGFFVAALHAKKYGRVFFEYDPHGIPEVAPEEVALFFWNGLQETLSVPLAFHRAQEYVNSRPSGDEHNAAYQIVSEDLDVTIEKSGFLSSLATVNLRAQQDGLAVVPLDLFPTLRVSKVENGQGVALDFVQENKDDDPDFGVVLAAPLKQGETATLKIAYGGKDVVLNEGGGNYYPVAREDWFPNAAQGLGDYANYHMLFHVPKGLQLIATGTRVSQSNEGNETISEWKTETPLPVVGFTLGDFEGKQTKVGSALAGQVEIDAFANRTPPDFVAPLAESGTLGSLSTTPMLANELSQGQAAVQIYTTYFGPLPFSHIALTQQSACNYGQSWPMLVYLPICGFFDDTQKHFLGIGGENLSNHMYWTVVTPHEVAHQWWGQTVGFRSYRDQWMSEGFADASASIFLQATRPKPDDYINFWNQERTLLTEKNQFGFRPVDVGPVTMGTRLSSPKAGWNIYQDLVYPKGAYILQMIRMMMWSPKDGDSRFIATMHDFVNTYRFQAATTEDFKATVERHMSPGMNLDGNGRMDWFFNQYVYGTELPAYHFDGQVTSNGDQNSLSFKLTQSGVSPAFRMPVPMYLIFADGKIVRLGEINAIGDQTIEHIVSLPKLPSPVKRVVINYYDDVLCTYD